MITNELVQALSFSFIQRAIISGVFISLSCSFLGPFLVLKNLSLIGDGLAHVAFATVALGIMFSLSPILVSVPLVILASFLILKLNEKANIDGDAAIGLVSSLAVSLGVLIASLSKGFNVDLFSFLFGNILIITKGEIIMSGLLCVTVVAGVILFYPDLFTITYDEEFALSQGLNVRLLNQLLIIFTSVTIALGIRIVGTMLISSLIIFPAVTALQISRGFKSTLAFSALFSSTSVVLGIFVSYILDIPTGATIVIINSIYFAEAFVLKKFILKR
ncbi:metal ABC transporter permease [uncultured Ilyobacter sp.]|uniref:metal ABC transporter permease n=1 Tax=uncultured Ilyobacter sp. TaxID=544433 RepID=UPI0029C638D5|nr:metal ABC transporter permease [uncultured Ilyobacter sp.]